MPFALALKDLEQRVRDPQQRGVIIRSTLAVGRLNLVDELARAERERGQTVHELAGARATQREPFGALAHLLPDVDLTQEPRNVLRSSHRVLGTGNRAERAVAIVEDAHMLDEWSAALLRQSALAGEVFVVLSVPRGKPRPEAISALIDAPGIYLLDVSAITETEMAEYIRILLDGPVDPYTLTELIRLSGGNPAWARHIIDDARQHGTLESVDGVWQQTGSLIDHATASVMAAEFLSALTGDEVEVLELLAIAHKLDLATLENLVGLDPNEEMEKAGFVFIDPICVASTASLASEAVRELLIGRMPETRRIRLSRRLFAALDKDDNEPTGIKDAPPSWLLEAGGLDDPRQCVQGARVALAKGDFTLAERFSTTAVTLGGGEEAKILRAEALIGLGRVAEGHSILASVTATATEDAHIAQGALIQMRHARLLAGRPEDARQIGEQALEKLKSLDWKDAIAAELALNAGLEGDYTKAAEFGTGVLSRPDAGRRALLDAAIVSSQAHVMLGKLDDALEIVQLGQSIVPELAAELPMARELLDFTEFQTSLWAGSLKTAQAFSETRLADALERRVPGWVGLCTLCSASVKLFQGRALEAAQTYCAGLGQLTSFDPLRIMPMGQAWRARAEVQAGKLRSAESTIRHIGPEYLPGEFRTSALTRSIEAWLRAQGGDSEGAATLAREAGFRLVDHTHIVWGCFLLHDAVRFGHGDRVTDQLAEIAPAVDSALIDSMAAHACALAERDAVRLLEVSKSFQDLGAALLAAEAAAQAASIHAKKHEQHASARATARAVHLAGFAPGADTPALRQLQSFLTPREQGIARLAAQGMSSRAIAEALSISTRTVDNHLGSVYAKLGIQGRNELSLVVQG